MSDNWFMAGTEGTGEYIVILRTRVGRVGYREIGAHCRIRVEPDRSGVILLGSLLTRSRGWKQPGDGNQNRYSIVIQREQLSYALGIAIRALHPEEVGATLNPSSPGWIKWIFEQATQDPITSSATESIDGVREKVRKADELDKALFQLFCDAFNQSELQIFLTYLPGESDLKTSLPSTNISLKVYAHEAVVALRRRGLINEMLFKELVKERPYRSADIEFIRDSWLS